MPEIHRFTSLREWVDLEFVKNNILYTRLFLTTTTAIAVIFLRELRQNMT